MPARHPSADAGQDSDRGGPRPDRLLPARHHHHPPCPVRQAPLRLRGRPARPARPLHPVDPHRPRQDRHPAAHPGPVPGLHALVRQRPAAPRAGRRTARPVPGRKWPEPKAGPRSPLAPRRRPAPAPSAARTRTTPNHLKRREISPLNPGTALRRTSVTAGQHSSVVGPRKPAGQRFDMWSRRLTLVRFARFWERQCPILGAELAARPQRGQPELLHGTWGEGLWRWPRAPV